MSQPPYFTVITVYITRCPPAGASVGHKSAIAVRAAAAAARGAQRVRKRPEGRRSARRARRPGGNIAGGRGLGLVVRGCVYRLRISDCPETGGVNLSLWIHQLSSNRIVE